MTYTSIGNIKAKVLAYGDYAYADRYRIFIHSPRIHSTSLNSLPKEKIMINCNSITLPGKSMATFEDITLLGPVRKYPYKQVFDDVTLSFYCDENLTERIFFEKWQELMYNEQRNEVQYYKDYIADMDIQILSKSTGKVKYVVKLQESFPITISPIELGYDNENTVIRQSITIGFRRWIRVFDNIPELLKDRNDLRDGVFDIGTNININLPNIGNIDNVNIPIPGGSSKFGINF